MDFEIFVKITQEQFLALLTNRLVGISKYFENVQTYERTQLEFLTYVLTVYRYPSAPNVGFVDVYDVFVSNGTYYLRHYYHDSTD